MQAHLARSVVHVLVNTRERCPNEPFRVIEQSQVEGTAFPIMLGCGLRYITNWHVVEDARNKLVYLATAQGGMHRTPARVVYTIPSMDIALLESELMLPPLEMERERVSSDSQPVFTVGYPEGLTLQKSMGYISGRSPEKDDHLILNMSINSGNSGGPIIDSTTQRVVGVATQTLQGVEAIAFAVPIWNVLRYLEAWYGLEGKIPRWPFKLQVRSYGFNKEFSCNLDGGAVVQEDCEMLKQGDVLLRIKSGNILQELDRWGQIVDPTRLSKTSVHAWPMILSLHPEQTFLDIWRRGMHLTVKMSPSVPEGVPSRWPEYDPPRYFLAGGLVFQELTSGVLEDEGDLCSAEQLLKIVHRVKAKKPLVVVSYIHPESICAKEQILKPYEIIDTVGRMKVKDIESLKAEMLRVVSRFESDLQQRLCLGVAGRKIYLDLDQFVQDEEQHVEDAGESGLFTLD